MDSLTAFRYLGVFAIVVDGIAETRDGGEGIDVNDPRRKRYNGKLQVVDHPRLLQNNDHNH
jgi:hypothetical protein